LYSLPTGSTIVQGLSAGCAHELRHFVIDHGAALVGGKLESLLQQLGGVPLSHDPA
jgi:hypothetical protein